jgi:parallel beta-helix repeat protein
MRNTPFPIVALLLALIAIPPATAGISRVPVDQTYYVSQDGNNHNSGLSWASAWRTLAHAARQVEPGDTVIIRKGSHPYRELFIERSGEPGRPIVFQGEPSFEPPVISGGDEIHGWTRSAISGVWEHDGAPRIAMVVEGHKALGKASSPHCIDGQWFWAADTLYYRPSDLTPTDHTVWAASRAGGIAIGDHSWIVIKNLYSWLGMGAGISVRRGQHDTISDVHVKWQWRGINIVGGDYDTVENCLVNENREGIYLSAGSSFNVIRGCQALYNGNLPLWRKGDRGGIEIGGSGVNTGNTVENCNIAYNGGPGSDPGLIAYQSPRTLLKDNYVHDNYGSGLFVTIHSDKSRIIGNLIENNGVQAVRAGDKGISSLSIRRTRDVLVLDNRVISNYVSPDSPWPGKELGPKGGLDVQGLPRDNMTDIRLENNVVQGTVGGPNLYVSPKPNLNGFVITPASTSLFPLSGMTITPSETKH